MNYNKNYLSKRPFLVVTAKFLPGDGARTAGAGWAEKSGWNIAEEVAIVDRVSNKHLQNGTLIVDILEGKAVKNGFRNATPDEAASHFLNKYKDQVKEAMGIWLEREARKLAASGVDLTPTEAAEELKAELATFDEVEASPAVEGDAKAE